MIVKDKFILLKDMPNVLNLPSSVLDKHTIENGVVRLSAIIKLTQNKLNHFAKDNIITLMNNPVKREMFRLVTLDKYTLPIAFNKPTNEILINISYFGTDDISTTHPDPRTLYALVLCGIVLQTIVLKKYKVKENFANHITNYLLAIFIRIFGKDYGLTGGYSTEIPKLKFLISCYVLSSFFGYDNGRSLYNKASGISTYAYRNTIEKLETFDFSNIEDFIKSLSESRVMPGMNRYIFTQKILRMLSINFIPMLEDGSRMISTLATNTVSGSTILPTYIRTYNEEEFNKIIGISKDIVRKM